MGLVSSCKSGQKNKYRVAVVKGSFAACFISGIEGQFMNSRIPSPSVSLFITTVKPSGLPGNNQLSPPLNFAALQIGTRFLFTI